MSGSLSFSGLVRVSLWFLEIGGWVVISVRKLPGWHEALCEAGSFVVAVLPEVCVLSAHLQWPSDSPPTPTPSWHLLVFVFVCVLFSFLLLHEKGGSEQKRLFHCFSLLVK